MTRIASALTQILTADDTDNADWGEHRLNHHRPMEFSQRYGGDQCFIRVISVIRGCDFFPLHRWEFRRAFLLSQDES